MLDRTEQRRVRAEQKQRAKQHGKAVHEGAKRRDPRESASRAAVRRASSLAQFVGEDCPAVAKK